LLACFRKEGNDSLYVNHVVLRMCNSENTSQGNKSLIINEQQQQQQQQRRRMTVLRFMF